MASSVEKLWPGETFVLLGCGPSLTPEDVDCCRHHSPRVIAINSSYQLAPWADVLYGCDGSWWASHKGVPAFAGLKYSLDASAARWPRVKVLKNCGTQGLEAHPTGLRTGNNSGYQAINLAVHLGAARIILLGYDMRLSHGLKHFAGAIYHGAAHSSFPQWLRHFETLIQPLQALGVDVLNCTPGSALTTFPRRPLRDVFRDAADTASDLAPMSSELA